VLRKPKHLIPALIFLFWLIMMSLLVYREVILPRMYRGLSAKSIDIPQDLWLGLFVSEEQQVGYAHLKTTPDERAGEKGYSLNTNARVEFPLFGQSTRLQLSGEAWISALTGLREFDFHINAADHEMRIEGKVQEGVVDAIVHTAGEQFPFKLPVGKELLLSGSLGLNAISLPQLSPGQVTFVDAFDPTTMMVGRAKIEALRYETLNVAGEQIETIVVATTISNITTRAWISREDEIVRAETPIGLIIKKIDPQRAASPLKADITADIIRTVAIKPKGPAPDINAALLRLRITGVDETLMPPEDMRQRRETEGDIWVITRQRPGEDMRVEPISAEDMEACLGSDMFIQALHPRIQKMAGEIVGETENTWDMAVRIHDWVYENIAKENVLSVPSALAVLEERRGDCNEHAVLFAALARAAGIPTRIAIGLAWSETLESFGYHAWPEVYVGQWIAMDPTFGERTVSPAHIKLFTGGIDQWSRLMAYIGTLKLEILDNAAQAPVQNIDSK
jgi:hypothetical protein